MTSCYHILAVNGRRINGVLQLAAVNNCIADWRIALTGHMVAQIVIELTICAIHPPPGTVYFYADLVCQRTVSQLNSHPNITL